ncbi:MAG: nucleoside 2-deoxyribosyltransferase domain-containing protein [Patescibacteria group bacterium]|nr:nucleoside 2-deoxyribosyltransferase domain-containing protein [Patescibacteria group bacterium]
MIITPPEFLHDRNAAIIFLAGPIKETPLWREEAIRIIQSKDKTLCIASPQRPGEIEEEFRGKKFHEQTRWELFYIKRALEKGVMLFWFPKEQPYIRNSGLELGIALASKGNMVVGIEPGFSEVYLRMTIAETCPDVKVCSTLEETCVTAAQLLQAAR